MDERVFNRLSLELVTVNKNISVVFNSLQQTNFRDSPARQQLEKDLSVLCKKRIAISKRLATHFDDL